MKRIKSFLTIFLLWTVVGIVSKVAFLAIYHSLFKDVEWTDQLAVLWYGLRLDMAIAGYLTIVPGLLLMISLWYGGKVLQWVWKAFFLLTAIATALGYVANLGLYGYWGFPLDNTPLLYVKTSPADAIASLTLWQMAGAVLAWGVCALVVYKLPHPLPADERKHPRGWQRFAELVLLFVMEGALLLPIRGGVGTGTNHTGSVYFSENIRVNHATVNPLFCFFESVVHQEEIGTKYRFMEAEEADRLFAQITYTHLRKDTLRTLQHPNVILIVLESFSDTVMRVKGVTPHLRRMTDEGLYFTSFYANSFRTDRALVSIHSGLPAQPTMSVMDMPRKSTSLPSIAGQLGKSGYHTVFYYGGDINYSNMRSYFAGTGFQKIVSDADFPMSLRTGKWGVADGGVFERMLADIKADNSGHPFFRSFMTGSSHEPFDVPDYHKFNDDEVLNAFSYTDHCLGRFIDELKKLPCWKNTLIAIVPDHLGAFPDRQDNYHLWRYHVPFVILGGQIPAGVQCHTVGSQIDIAATLLGLLGIDHQDFPYSKDLLDEQSPHFAFFTFPDAMGMVTDTSAVVYDNTDGRVHLSENAKDGQLLRKAKAYLQKLYDDLDKR